MSNPTPAQLSANVISLLNSFADTQIALRTPKQPLSKSNPNLGTSLQAALLYSGSAPGTTYTPGTPSNWNATPPTTLQAALDRIAAALVAAGHTP